MLLGFLFVLCFCCIWKSKLHLVFFFFPHDVFVFQQDCDSYLNVMQRPRTLGILPEGPADIWVVSETVILSIL